MLFMAKVQKPWALFILGMISPIIMLLGGHTYVVVLHSLVVMFIAEMIRRAGGYKSLKFNMLALWYLIPGFAVLLCRCFWQEKSILNYL